MTDYRYYYTHIIVLLRKLNLRQLELRESLKF